MADLAVVAASVDASRCATHTVQYAGAAVTQGEPVYRHKADGLWYPALNDTLEHASARGVAVNAASAGQALTVATEGDLVLGVQPVVGAGYYVSANAGGICPAADVVAGKWVMFLGIGKPNNTLGLALYNPGVQHA